MSGVSAWSNVGTLGGSASQQDPASMPQFTASETAGPATVDTNALVDLGWAAYMARDLWYRRTRTPEWREGVRERLATGLDDAPVLP